MIVLQYPSYPFKIKALNGKDQIFDPFRKTWVLLTPEEWVRQNLLQYLVQSLDYPSSLIAVEKEIKLGELSKRFDIVVYKNEMPWMIIECKEAKVALNEKTMDQILQYQQVLMAQYLFMSNGHETLGAKIESGKLQALQNFPDYA
ncbi:MAG: type I restriction enzyme HsdR N-terminal domain-containing protein [Chitinophagia bacterium]